MRLRWYQSRLFWLGVVFLTMQLMVCICFSKSSLYVSWSTTRSYYAFGWESGAIGGVSFRNSTVPGMGPSKIKGFGHHSEFREPVGNVEFFAPAFQYSKIDSSDPAVQRGWTFTVAHWVWILLQCGLWGGAVIRNQRRKRKWLAEKELSCPQMGAEIQ